MRNRRMIFEELKLILKLLHAKPNNVLYVNRQTYKTKMQKLYQRQK